MRIQRGLLLLLSVLWCGAAIGCLAKSAAAQLDAPPSAKALCLPAAVEGTDLIAQGLVCYEGTFREDGTGEEVVDAAGLLLTNRGDATVKRATVYIEQGGRDLRFVVTWLPPGATALVVEERAQPYLPGEVTRCFGSAITGAQWVSGVRVEETDDHTLQVANDSDRSLSGLRLHIKSYHWESGVYIGGITYTIEVGDLAAGDSVILSPFHYVSGYSRVVAVTQA